MDESIQDEIEQLSDGLVGEALKNLRLLLEQEAGRLSDDELRTVLRKADLEGASAELRDAIVTDRVDPVELARWGRPLLRMAAADESLSPLVVRAVNDAREHGVMDFGVGSLLILGAVTVLWRYRPHRLHVRRGEVKVEWSEEDDGQGLAKVLRALFGGIVGGGS